MRRDDTARAVQELREVVASFLVALSRTSEDGPISARDLQQQTAQLVAALREVPPTSAVERREMADTGRW